MAETQARARAPPKAKGRIEDAERMIGELAAVKQRTANNQPVQIDFTATGRRTKRLLAAKGLEKSLGGRTLFFDLDLTLSPARGWACWAPTAAEKPPCCACWPARWRRTMARCGRRKACASSSSTRAGRAGPDLRSVARSPLTATPALSRSPVHVAGWAKRFLFRPEQLELPLADLSGGEQARLLIAKLMLEPADVLLLDEPTNDLDIPSLEVLEDSLEDFPGALVLVTHDRYMLDSVCSALLALDGQGKTGFFADFAQWERAAAIEAENARKGEGEKREKGRKGEGERCNLAQNRFAAQIDYLERGARTGRHGSRHPSR